MINYSPPSSWLEGGLGDQHFLSYNDHGTFTVTQQHGANMNLTFHGTTIWLFGAKRANHGSYTVSIDNQQTLGNGYNNQDIFGQVLFSAGVASGVHTVVLTNTGNVTNSNWLDIDYIAYETQVDDTFVAVTQQDTDPAFSYSDSWSTKPDNLSYYNGGTGHTTVVTGAYVTYTFQGICHILSLKRLLSFLGSAVQIFGTAGPNNGFYSVQMDGGPSSVYNATKSYFFPQTMIYENNGLGLGTHTVKLVNVPSVDGQNLNIDYAVVSQPPSSSQTSGSRHRSSSGQIWGIVAGACGIVALAISILFLLLRRRNKQYNVPRLSIPVSNTGSMSGSQGQMSDHPVPHFLAHRSSISRHSHTTSGPSQYLISHDSVDYWSTSGVSSAATYNPARTDLDSELELDSPSEPAQLTCRKERRALQGATGL